MIHLNMYEVKPLSFNPELDGISKKTNEIHHDKLYAGYVNKANEVGDKLTQLRKDIVSGKVPGGSTNYSELRALKLAEIFVENGMNLHEIFFSLLGGDGDYGKAPELAKAINGKWDSVEDFIKYFTECAMAARGWSMLAWNIYEKTLRQYNGDSHDHAMWGCVPILALDVYEHAYFIDHGSDRKAYLAAFFKNLNWTVAEELFKKVSTLSL